MTVCDRCYTPGTPLDDRTKPRTVAVAIGASHLPGTIWTGDLCDDCRKVAAAALVAAMERIIADGAQETKHRRPRLVVTTT